MEARERQVVYYAALDGSTPFAEWRKRITDRDMRAAVDARISRMEGGIFSDSRPIGDGASENRIHLGPGLRIYYGTYGEKIVLLWGGDKSSQSADITKAKEFWNDYKERKKKKKNAAKS